MKGQMNSYKDDINKIIRTFVDAQTEARKGWDDSVQRDYYRNYLDSLSSEASTYVDRIDNLMEQLRIGKQHIDSLLGDNIMFNTSFPKELER